MKFLVLQIRRLPCIIRILTKRENKPETTNQESAMAANLASSSSLREDSVLVLSLAAPSEKDAVEEASVSEVENGRRWRKHDGAMTGGDKRRAEKRNLWSRFIRLKMAMNEKKKIAVKKTKANSKIRDLWDMIKRNHTRKCRFRSVKKKIELTTEEQTQKYV